VSIARTSPLSIVGAVVVEIGDREAVDDHRGQRNRQGGGRAVEALAQIAAGAEHHQVGPAVTVEIAGHHRHRVEVKTYAKDARRRWAARW
jgi:hypothetical protein